jgi:hypothetical protein
MPPGNAGGCRAIVEPWYAGSRRNGRRTRRSRPLRRDRPRRAPDVSSVESSSLRRATRPMRSSSPSGAALPEGVVRSLPCWPAVGLRVTSAVERQRALATSPLAGWFGRLTALGAAWSIGGRLRFRSWRERRMSSRFAIFCLGEIEGDHAVEVARSTRSLDRRTRSNASPFGVAGERLSTGSASPSIRWMSRHLAVSARDQASTTYGRASSEGPRRSADARHTSWSRASQ